MKGRPLTRSVRTLEEQVRAAESERRLAEYEDQAAGDEILAAETQLTGSDLDEAERVELTDQKNALITEGQQRLRRSRIETAERESVLQREVERERAITEDARRRLSSLQGDPAGALPSKAAQ